MINTIIRRTFILLAVAMSIVPFAKAQSAGLSTAGNQRAIHEDHVANQAFLLVKVKAREALRQRDFVKVERLVSESRSLTDSIDEGNFPAKEILAESYVVQGKYGLALSETGDGPELLGGRFGMTKALALLGVGRRAEARAQILGQIGTSEEPSELRERNVIWEGWEGSLPANGSDSGLKAAALLIRALHGRSDGSNPETRADLETAVGLVPGNGLAHFLLAEQLRGDDLDRALKEALKAQTVGEPQLRKEAAKLVEELRFSIAHRTPPSGG